MRQTLYIRSKFSQDGEFSTEFNPNEIKTSIEFGRIQQKMAYF